MKRYAGQKIRKAWQGRAVDIHRRVPYAMCILAFTKDHHFYLLEEKLDGTYDEHLSLPLERIVDISKMQFSQDGKTMGSVQESATSGSQDVLTQSGVFMVKPSKKRKPKSYLMLTYYDNTLYQTYICFPFIKGNMNSIVRYFQKIKRRYA